jgi:hypothetical protein
MTSPDCMAGVGWLSLFIGGVAGISFPIKEGNMASNTRFD